jgi:hypothetical protein
MILTGQFFNKFRESRNAGLFLNAVNVSTQVMDPTAGDRKKHIERKAPSFPRKRESSKMCAAKNSWIPAFAGMTAPPLRGAFFGERGD